MDERRRRRRGRRSRRARPPRRHRRVEPSRARDRRRRRRRSRDAVEGVAGVDHRRGHPAQRRALAARGSRRRSGARRRRPARRSRVEEAVGGGGDDVGLDQRRGAEAAAGDVEPPDAAEGRRLLGLEHPPLRRLGRARPPARSSEAAARSAQAAGVRPTPASAAGRGPPVAQSRSSTVWTTGTAVPAPICIMQPMLPAAITCGRLLLEGRHLAGAELARDLRLQQVVGAGRAAAEVAVARLDHLEARGLEQRLRLASRTCWPCCSEQAAW